MHRITLSDNQVKFEVADPKDRRPSTTHDLPPHRRHVSFAYERVIPQSSLTASLPSSATLDALGHEAAPQSSPAPKTTPTASSCAPKDERHPVASKPHHHRHQLQPRQRPRRARHRPRRHPGQRPLEIAFNAKYLIDVLSVPGRRRPAPGTHRTPAPRLRSDQPKTAITSAC